MTTRNCPKRLDLEGYSRNKWNPPPPQVLWPCFSLYETRVWLKCLPRVGDLHSLSCSWFTTLSVLWSVWYLLWQLVLWGQIFLWATVFHSIVSKPSARFHSVKMSSLVCRQLVPQGRNLYDVWITQLEWRQSQHLIYPSRLSNSPVLVGVFIQKWAI